MDDIKFSSLSELYNKLKPALNTKVTDLKRHDIKHIGPQDIWLYLKNHYWHGVDNLTLGDMVNDILSTPNQELVDFMAKKPDQLTKKNKPDSELL